MIRIFKIVRSWTSLRSILLTVANALPQVGNLAFLTSLFTFIYALIGKQFFSEKPLLYEDGSESPYSFKTIGDSLITVFILITSENWTEISHLTMNTYGVYAVIYFISAILIGHFMLLNLFLAILLRYISAQIEFENKEKKIQKELKERQERMIKMATMTKEDFLREEGPCKKKV
jgi:voltage-gated potassium channel Kch